MKSSYSLYFFGILFSLIFNCFCGSIPIYVDYRVQQTPADTSSLSRVDTLWYPFHITDLEFWEEQKDFIRRQLSNDVLSHALLSNKTPATLYLMKSVWSGNFITIVEYNAELIEEDTYGKRKTYPVHLKWNFDSTNLLWILEE